MFFGSFKIIKEKLFFLPPLNKRAYISRKEIFFLYLVLEIRIATVVSFFRLFSYRTISKSATLRHGLGFFRTNLALFECLLCSMFMKLITVFLSVSFVSEVRKSSSNTTFYSFPLVIQVWVSLHSPHYFQRKGG